MAFTVSAAVTNILTGAALKVFACTGVAETGGNPGGVSAYAAPNVSFTPAVTGSLIVFGIQAYAALTAEPSCTLSENSTFGAEYYADGYFTGTVTSGVAVTVGSSTPASQSNLAVYELVPSGTPAIDGSTPAAATATSSPVTSASFTPPGGAVLAAVVMYDYWQAPGTVTISDTSGLGLTWTPRAAYQGAAYAGGASLFTATLSGGPVPATRASGAGAALNPSVVLSTITIGPKYAGTATDLGGVYGSWGTPQFATGGP